MKRCAALLLLLVAPACGEEISHFTASNTARFTLKLTVQDAAEQDVPGEDRAAAAEDQHFDHLPGGTAVAWPQGQRPAWFTALLAEQLSKKEGRAENKTVKVELTEKQRRKCLRVACKMVKKSQSGVKLREVVDKILATLSLEEGAEKSRFRSKVKTLVKKGDGWSLSNGMLTAAVAVVA
jgi:hypothetical protein